MEPASSRQGTASPAPASGRRTGQPACDQGTGIGQLVLRERRWLARDQGQELASSGLGNRTWLARAWRTALASARSWPARDWGGRWLAWDWEQPQLASAQ